MSTLIIGILGILFVMVLIGAAAVTELIIEKFFPESIKLIADFFKISLEEDE